MLERIPGKRRQVMSAKQQIRGTGVQGQTPTSRSSRREDSASSTMASTPHSEDSGTHDFGTLHCLTYAA